jgi:hypothetical protein
MAAFFGQNEGYKWFTSEHPLAIDALLGALKTGRVGKPIRG